MRPTFLTVLCILTFIGSGWGIVSAFTNYSSAETAAAITEEAFDKALDKIESEEEVPDFISSIFGSISKSMTAENIKNGAIASGIAALLTLLGAVLMWQLNKKGFYLYLIGSAIAVLAPIFILGGTLGGFGAAGSGFIATLFCILYGLNLKHMS